MSLYFRKERGTGIHVEVDFEFMGKMYKEEVDVPWDIFAQAFVVYAGYKDVTIDGRDKSVWNLLVDINAIPSLEDNKDFLEECKTIYLKSNYYEQDKEEWLEQTQEDYDFENSLGDYAPKKDGE